MNSDLFLSNNSECNYCETKQAKPNLYPSNRPKNFTYFHFNIRSLQKNFESLEQLLINLNIQPDVIGLMETKIKINASNYISNQLPGYHFLHTDSATNSGGVSIGIFIKDNVDFVLREDLKSKSLDCENLWLELKNKNIIIGVARRHPFYNIVDFKSNLIKTVEKINHEKAIFSISGDFKIDYLKYNTCSRISSYINEVYSYGGKLLIDKSTKITHSTASCIGHFYTNNQVNKIKIRMLINDITDYPPLLINIRTHTHKIQPEKYKYRCFKNFDIDLFLENVSKCMTSLEQTFNAISPIKIDFTLFKNVFTDIINMHAPLREATKKQRNLQKKPWMTKAILKSIITKNKLFKRYITSSNKDDHSKYKKYRNKLNHIICAAKSNYHNNAAFKYKSNSSNIREIWHLINEIIQNRRLQNREKMQLKSNKKLIEDSSTIANKFNSFLK